MQQQSPLLISIQEFTAKSKDAVILDASWSWTSQGPHESFLEKRIPGARFFDHTAVKDPQSSLHDTAPNAQHFSRHMSALGIQNDDWIILYGQGAFSSAARAWYLLRLFGHERVSVLDGGLGAYQSADLPLEIGEPPTVPPSNYVANLDPNLIVDVEGMKASLSKGVQTIDGRPPAFYSGERDFFEKQGGPAAGKPGRIAEMPNVPTSALADDGKLKDAASLRALFEGEGLDLSQRIVTTCSLGVGASGVAFALALAGAEDVAVFDGSYEAWAAAS